MPDRTPPCPFTDLDPDLRARLTALFDEGWELWVGFDTEVRRKEWHPFLGHPLDDFDVVHGYPWGGEEALMLDLMQRRGGREATLLLDDGKGGTQLYRGGRRVS